VTPNNPTSGHLGASAHTRAAMCHPQPPPIKGNRSDRPQVVILGAGPAGVGAAFLFCDHGSHRLHPAVDGTILRDLESLLGADLRLRALHADVPVPYAILEQDWDAPSAASSIWESRERNWQQTL
jgi:hypothetical protein